MLRRCARKMAASFIQRMSAAFYGHADHCSRDVVFFDCVRRRLLAWTDAGVLAGTKAWRDDGYSLRGAFSTYRDRACRSMASQKVQHENERSFARRSRSRWSVSAAARGRCCRKPPSRDYTAQQLSHLATPAGLIYMGLLLAYVVMPVLVNWPRLSGANARSTEHNP